MKIIAVEPRKSSDLFLGTTLGIEPVATCVYIRKEGASCSLNNNCKYPNCDG